MSGGQSTPELEAKNKQFLEDLSAKAKAEAEAEAQAQAQKK